MKVDINKFTVTAIVLILSLILSSSLSSSLTFGRDIFVNSSVGDDINSGLNERDNGTQNGPVRTIRQGLKLSRAGDRLILDASKPYKESITLSGKNISSRNSENAFIIEGRGAILDGTEPIPMDVWKFYKDDIFRFQLTLADVNVTYFHILKDNKPIKRIHAASDATHLPNLEIESWCLFRGYIYFRTNGKKSPMFAEDYDLSYSERKTGISIIQANNIKIHDLTVQGYQLDGIAAVNGAMNIILDDVTCCKNGRSGLAVGGGSSVAAGYSNFVDNCTTQVLLLQYAKYIFHKCYIPKNGITNKTK
ncbi:MAG: hypothetical protein LBE18_04635 [Planctomycetaceae bacterium]|jgi:hypothetical protein|nr:hypothetical protein [Planctomycetaceae bacterium]